MLKKPTLHAYVVYVQYVGKYKHMRQGIYSIQFVPFPWHKCMFVEKLSF